MFRPVVTRTRTIRRTVDSGAYDCVSFAVLRQGSVVINIDSIQKPVTTGDVVLLAPGTYCRCEPEGLATFTTLHVDTDYLIDLFFWQQVCAIPDRHAARDLAEKLYPDPVQVLRIGEHQLARLTPALDELALSSESGGNGRFFRMQGLLSTVIDVLAPRIRTAPLATVPANPLPRHRRASTPRWRQFVPLRVEAQLVEALLRRDITRRWRRDELAAHACLSTAQMCRVFTDAYGVTPQVYLTILRVHEMARLLRETDLTIEAIAQRVGWRNRSYATAAFRRYVGVNPSPYRQHGPPTVSKDGPGVTIAHIASKTLES